jgi:hypothetical protein
MRHFLSLVLATVVATTTALAAVQTVTNDNVTCGTNVTITAEPAVGHHFIKWSDGNKNATRTLENVTGDIDLTAIFAIDTFTITFMANGTVYDTQYVTYGSTPAVPTGTPASYQTDEFNYTFSNWPTLAAATEDATYNAVYTQTKRSYTITWKMDDNSTIEQTTVEYGVVPTHADPVKAATAEYTYTFTGWTPNVVAVTGDATYTATFSATKNSYTITWKMDDGTLIDETTVEYGVVPTHADPVKPSDDEFSYTFAGWTPAVSAVTGNATYTATFTTTTRKYTVTVVVSGDGGTASVVGNATVDYGEQVTIKAVAADCYEFDKWVEDGNTAAERAVTVTGDATYTATFKVLIHSVTIKSNDGEQGTVRFVTQ